MKILVVDDEQDICEIMQYNLETEGYEVVTANSAEEAMSLPLGEFSLILLDVMMGEMSGFQMARKLKDNPETALVPIIFTTALDDEDNMVKGLNIGADDYIAKPLSIKEVKARIKAVLRRVSTQRKNIKRLRRKQIIAMRRIDPMLSVEKGTWYFLINSSLSQMVYCLKRMGDPCKEHIGNNFRPVASEYASEFAIYRDEIAKLLERHADADSAEEIRNLASNIKDSLSEYRKRIICDIQTKHLNIESMTVFLNLVQESNELLNSLRHTLRGINKFSK